MPPSAELIDLIAAQSNHSPAPGLLALRDRLLQRYGKALQGILYYGSCLRSGDPFDGLVDLYVIVNNYQAAYHKRFPALANTLLPPNVFYLEHSLDAGTIRTKYAVLSLRDLHRGSSRWFHSYIWARFSQPIGLLYARDAEIARQIHDCLAQAVLCFVRHVVPRLPETFSNADLWQRGLMLTYRAELRSEKADRARELYARYQDYFDSRGNVALASLPCIQTKMSEGHAHYQAKLNARQRISSRLDWELRTIQGKGLSLLRLLKAFFTFEGGLDYIVWKLERHSGVTIEITPRLRRYPLIFIWGLMWRLYRQGVFR